MDSSPAMKARFWPNVRMALRNNITDRNSPGQRRGPFEPLASSKTSPEPSPYDIAEGSELLDRYESGTGAAEARSPRGDHRADRAAAAGQKWRRR